MAVAVVPARATVGFDHKRFTPGLVQIVAGVFALFAFGLGTRTAGNAKTTFQMSILRSSSRMNPWVLPARTTIVVLAAICIALGVVRLAVVLPRGWRNAATSTFFFCFVLTVMAWTASDTAGSRAMNLPDILDATVVYAVPLILGALGGVIGERSGVVNVAIEGQLLFGAFMTALIGTVTHNTWIGVVAGVLAGGLMGLLLAVLAIRYLIEQVVLGVVLNLLALGFTGFLYKALMQTDQASYNSVTAFQPTAIPGLSKIPVVGAVLFDQPVLVYVTVFLVVVVHLALFRTRWGLRTRAVGEHPAAADTVGIKVLRIRYRNVVLGGMLAGLGGAWLLGNVGQFTEQMTAGKGFIALAAVIFGRWSPFGAMGAATLFGFATALSDRMSQVGTPIPSELLGLLPYLATIFAVGGLIGRVRAPAADGKPYVKS